MKITIFEWYIDNCLHEVKSRYKHGQEIDVSVEDGPDDAFNIAQYIFSLGLNVMIGHERTHSTETGKGHNIVICVSKTNFGQK